MLVTYSNYIIAVCAAVCVASTGYDLFLNRRTRASVKRRTGYVVTLRVPSIPISRNEEYAGMCVLSTRSNVVAYIDSSGEPVRHVDVRRGDMVLCLDNGLVYRMSWSGRLVVVAGNAHDLVCSSYIESVDPCVIEIPYRTCGNPVPQFILRCSMITFHHLSNSLKKSQKGAAQ